MDNLSNQLRVKLDAYYKTSRGLEQGLDPNLRVIDIAMFALSRARMRLRGMSRGLAGVYVGRGVTLRHRHHVRFARSVSIGDFVTINGLSRDGLTIGRSVTIDAFAILRGSGVVRRLGVGISIGDFTSIGAHNVLLGQGGLSIGRNCLLGPGVTVVTENHQFSDAGTPIRAQGDVRASVTIEDDVWIGSGVVILPGAFIESGAVVAAGAVVRGRVNSNTVVGGVPAREIARRA